MAAFSGHKQKSSGYLVILVTFGHERSPLRVGLRLPLGSEISQTEAIKTRLKFSYGFAPIPIDTFLV